MFNQKQLIQLEYALKYVIGDLEHAIQSTEDALWLGELHGILATVQAEQQHEATLWAD